MVVAHEERVDRLEREIRRLRRSLLGLAAVFCGAAAAAFVAGDESRETLRAQRIEIVDAEGRPLGLIGSAEGKAALAFLDREGRTIVSLGADDFGNGRLLLSKETGETAVTAGTGRDGRPAVGVVGPDGPVAALAVDSAGHGNLSVRAREVGGLVNVGIDASGNGTVQVSGAKGAMAAAFGADGAGGGRVSLFAPKGEGAAQLRIDPNGSGQLLLQNKKGALVCIAGAEANGHGTLLLRSAKGGDAVNLRSDAEGNGRILVAADGKVAAQLGATTDGLGVLVVAGEEGDRRFP